MSRQLRVYVSCALTHASEEYKAEINWLAKEIGSFCEVLSFVGLEGQPPIDIYRHDIEFCVDSCDLLVMVGDVVGAATGSDGRGFELAVHLRGNHRPVLALLQHRSRLSAISLGAFERYPELCEIFRYQKIVQTVPIIRQRVVSLERRLGLQGKLEPALFS